MRHVLLVVDRAAGRRIGQQAGHDIAPVSRLRGQHFFAHRMIGAGLRQIGGIERLVDDPGVRCAAPNERIIAVEMLRGPDHIAMRTSIAQGVAFNWA